MKKQKVSAATLAVAQQHLEVTSHEYQLSISNFEKAQGRMLQAEQDHMAARMSLANEVQAVIAMNKIVPLNAR